MEDRERAYELELVSAAETWIHCVGISQIE